MRDAKLWVGVLMLILGVTLLVAFSTYGEKKGVVHKGKTISEWISSLEDKDDNVRGSAANALGEIGPEAKEAIPGLIKLLKDKNDDVRWSAIKALALIGPEAIPSATEALKDKNEIVRRSAAYVLAEMGPKAKEALPAVIEALKDKKYIVRSAAAWVLEKIGPEAKEAIPALIETLEDKEVDVRWRTSQALASIGSAAIPALIQALKHKKEKIRAFAAWTLGEIGKDAKNTIPYLIEALKDENRMVRACAAHALGEFGLEAKEAVPALIDALKEREGFWEREHAYVVAEALGKIGDLRAISALCDACKSNYGGLHYYSNKALEAIGTEDALACVKYRDYFRCPICGEINMFEYCYGDGHYYCEKHYEECRSIQLQSPIIETPYQYLEEITKRKLKGKAKEVGSKSL